MLLILGMCTLKTHTVANEYKMAMTMRPHSTLATCDSDWQLTTRAVAVQYML